MNQKFATYLAIIFLISVGFFNMLFTMSNIQKRKARKGLLWFRFIAGFLVFCAGGALAYYFFWMRKT